MQLDLLLAVDGSSHAMVLVHQHAMVVLKRLEMTHEPVQPSLATVSSCARERKDGVDELARVSTNQICVQVYLEQWIGKE